MTAFILLQQIAVFATETIACNVLTIYLTFYKETLRNPVLVSEM